MHGDDGFRPGRDPPRHVLGGDVSRPWIDVGPDDRPAERKDRRVGGDTCHRGGDDFVARPHTREPEGKVQRRGSAVDGQDLRCPEPVAKLVFEALDLRALADPTGQQHLPERVDHRVGHEHFEERDRHDGLTALLVRQSFGTRGGTASVPPES